MHQFSQLLSTLLHITLQVPIRTQPISHIAIPPRGPNGILSIGVAIRKELLELLAFHLCVRLDDIVVDEPLARLRVGPGGVDGILNRKGTWR